MRRQGRCSTKNKELREGRGELRDGTMSARAAPRAQAAGGRLPAVLALGAIPAADYTLGKDEFMKRVRLFEMNVYLWIHTTIYGGLDTNDEYMEYMELILKDDGDDILTRDMTPAHFNDLNMLTEEALKLNTAATNFRAPLSEILASEIKSLKKHTKFLKVYLKKAVKGLDFPFQNVLQALQRGFVSRSDATMMAGRNANTQNKLRGVLKQLRSAGL